MRRRLLARDDRRREMTHPSEKQALRETMIAALESLQTAHVSLACPDCAEEAWDFVVDHLTEFGYRILPAEPTEAMWAAVNVVESGPNGGVVSKLCSIEGWRAMLDAAE